MPLQLSVREGRHASSINPATLVVHEPLALEVAGGGGGAAAAAAAAGASAAAVPLFQKRR